MPNYSGLWTLQAQMQAKAQGLWTYPPLVTGLAEWGQNGNGQLGLNDKTYRSSPTQVGAVSTWSKLSYGGRVVNIVTTTGTLLAWGLNSLGGLGLGDTVSRSSPTQVGALTNWSNNAVNYQNNVIAVKSNGTLWAWGSNDYGQLGLNDIANRSSPVQVGALTTWSKVFSTDSSSFAVKTDGTLWAWGRNTSGNLGLNDRTYRSSPVQIGALTTWSTVAGGLNSVIATKTDGTLWSWGSNENGQLGQNDRIYRSSPVQIGALTTWSKISGGGNTSFHAIKTDGTLWAWGSNAQGVLGVNDIVYRSSPVQVGSGTTWLNISSSYSVLATKTNGTLWSWGYNGQGQLGQNDRIYRSSPVQVGDQTNWGSLGQVSVVYGWSSALLT